MHTWAQVRAYMSQPVTHMNAALRNPTSWVPTGIISLFPHKPPPVRRLWVLNETVHV